MPHGDNYDDKIQSISELLENLNEIFASQMNKTGLTVEAIPIGTLNLEREEHYNNDISSNPRFITNRGCIKIKDKEISMIQIIQRF